MIVSFYFMCIFDDDLELEEKHDDVGYVSERDFELEMEALAEYRNEVLEMIKGRGPNVARSSNGNDVME
ncbi:hypothetical protein LIER_19168 [Lithospermum erythrorhizon]|uniref:Uncharacterized protein n=1 Tax=Lithospermum erythrorhizon TaxID=34254 RepID=A0AAV3QGT5_LITER